MAHFLSRRAAIMLGPPLLASLVAIGCSNAETLAPSATAQTQSSPLNTVTFGLGSAIEGERLFGRECAFCHVGKSTGAMMLGRRLGKEKAELHKRADLDPDYVKAVVRNGLMNMPPLSRVELTDAELNAIAAWLARSGK